MRKVAIGAAGLAVLGAGAAMYDEGVRRSLRFCRVIAPVALEHKLVDWRGGAEEQHRLVDEKRAGEVLQGVLELGGYYVKAGQTLVGSGLLSEEFEAAFEPLLDSVPPRDFETVIRPTVEAELNRPLGDVFGEFDTWPLGAASIGQVHRARLRDSGQEVAVKVQYPDVARFFRIDFGTIKLLARFGGDFGEEIERILEDMINEFEREFDYQEEAASLREMGDNLRKSPFATFATISEPLEEYCTPKVLTMEFANGQSIRSYIREMMGEVAVAEGFESADAYLKHLKSEMKQDPSKMVEFMATEGPSEVAMDLYAWWAWLTGATVPLNGPRLSKLLFNIHAHQIFHDGFFNSDPHAGNILYDRESDKLQLVDFGATRHLSMDERLSFARLIVAIDEQDDDAIVQAFVDCGCSTVNMDRTFLLAYALLCFHRGYYPADMERLGLPSDDPQGIELHLAKFDQWNEFPPHFVMLQRCAMVLQGVAGQVGAGNVSVAGMWASEARAFLKSII